MKLVYKLLKLALLLGLSIFLSRLVLTGATPPGASQQQTAPDNPEMNKGDSQKGAVTADQQEMHSADREITRKIRASIMDDEPGRDIHRSASGGTD